MKTQDEEIKEPAVTSSNTSTSPEQPPSSPMHQRRIESVNSTCQSLTVLHVSNLLLNFELL